jgi:hypothetical protein
VAGDAEKMLKAGKKVGCYFGTSEQLNELATQRGCRFLKNVTGRNTELTTFKASYTRSAVVQSDSLSPPFRECRTSAADSQTNLTTN